MTINDALAYVASQWDWACLDGCFGRTRIKPTDIDGFVERNGRFLVLETKLPGVPIPEGQRITIKRLAETGRFVIYVVWGRPGVPEKILAYRDDKEVTIEPATMQALRHLVRCWFAWAERGRRDG